MRAAFDRRRQTIVELLRAIPGVALPDAAGRVLRLPVGAGAAGQPIARAHGRRPASSWPQLMLEQAEVAVVPGEAFGTPGYFRLSYALGDDDLRTGVERMGALLAEAK